MKLVTPEEMREFDSLAVRRYGIPGIVLMENAGRGAADIVTGELKRLGGRRVSVIAGKGNNGGDGFVCARHLKNRGFDVEVFSLSAPSGIKGDAGINARIWGKMGGGIYPVRTIGELKKHVLTLRHSSLIVDAILGTGVSTPLTGVYASVIELINKLNKPVVSVDVPSGLDAATGRALGAAVKATVTATMALPKLGLWLYPGRDYAGRVEVVDIGAARQIFEGMDIRHNLIDAQEVKGALSPRKRDTHKGIYGHVLVIGGSPGKTGAPYMAALGAMRAGAGLVTIALPESLNPIMEAKTTEVMTHPLPETEDSTLGESSIDDTLKILEGKTAVVIGPGMGLSGRLSGYTEAVIGRCAEKRIPIVIDADGLNALGGSQGRLAGSLLFLKKASGKTGIILTPHPREMARLVGAAVKDVQGDRVGFSGRLSKETGSVVVLKGASTVVAFGGEVFINPTGNPGMATAGTGDVLSGITGGLLSQGLDMTEAAVAAVYIHGLSGDEAAKKRGEAGMMATDLLAEVPAILNSFIRG